MFKKTFLFVSVIILVLIAFAGCDNFKSKLSTQTTDDKAWDIFFNKGASSSDVQKAEEHIRTQLIKDGFNSQLVEEILGSLREGTSPLFIASSIGRYDWVKKCIANGANVNEADEYGMTALMFIGFLDEHRKYKDQYPEIVKALVAAGADVNKQAVNGITALFEVHDAKAIKELIKAGADVNIKANGDMTALMMAVIFVDDEAVKALIDAGANINDVNKEGFTALISAVKKGNKEAVKVLISAGADVNAVNNKGETPLSIAKEKGHNEIANILKQAGAEDIAIIFN